ncbi:hypothetical protein HYN59_11730 [Flavobacterium album]|uniref:Uncharacterized protein n=2 Tax=Flavobacterium album TaxID=2175091 RepID=A0A2S1QZ85_9FLAO|nr:hypothetical protein HYN59_11730 [Flavobacterium album]
MICVCGPLTAQTTIYNGEKCLTYHLKHEANDTMSITGIQWEREKPSSEFTLKGKVPVKYSLQLENDTIAKLVWHNGKKDIFQEMIHHIGWPIRRIDGKNIISEFKITDFDKDGDEDLLCIVASNMNGNQWTIIYLNDQNQTKLVKLLNNADNTDIWDNPHYDNKTKLIECELFSGAYGIQSNYTFRLEKHNAIPVYKEERDLTNEEPVIQEFVGENGEWKLKKE